MIKRSLIILFILIALPCYAQRDLTTNEAVKITVGPFYDSTDGITPETALDVTTLTVELLRQYDDNSTPTRVAFVPTASGGSNDMVLITSSISADFSLELTAAQLNFTGFLRVRILDTDSASIAALPVFDNFRVTTANVVDAGYGTDYLQTDTKQLDGSGVQQASGYIKVSDGTGTGQIQLDSGRVLLLAATETQIDDIETAVLKIDTSTELRTLMTGADTPVAKGTDVTTAHSTTDGLVNGIDDNAWDDGTRTLTANTNFNDPTAAVIVNEWESQSQADPTGFHVNLYEVNGNSTPINNWEDTFDGTGYADDNAPATQLQLATVSGGVSIAVVASSRSLTEGEETLTYAATATDDGIYYEVASDSVSDDIDFYLIFNTGGGMNLPVSFHLHGYYEDNNAPASSTLVVQAYNFNIADWDTILTLSDSASALDFILPLHIHDVDPDGGGEGDVRIRFKLVATEITQNMRIDHATVNYVSGGLTAAAVVDEWESQSQSDPTGFHVNTMEWNSTGVNADTAGYPSVTVKDGTGTGEIDTSSGTVLLRSATEIQIDNIETDTNELQVDWTDGGRLDLIIDIIQAYWDSLTITGGYLEIDLVNLDGTAVKSTGGNIHALPGNI